MTSGSHVQLAHGPMYLSVAALSLHAQTLTKPGLLVLDGNVRAGGALVCRPDIITDLFVLRLLDGGLCGTILA